MATFKSKFNVGDLISYVQEGVEYFGRITSIMFGDGEEPAYQVVNASDAEWVAESLLTSDKKERKPRTPKEKVSDLAPGTEN